MLQQHAAANAIHERHAEYRVYKYSVTDPLAAGICDIATNWSITRIDPAEQQTFRSR